MREEDLFILEELKSDKRCLEDRVEELNELLDETFYELEKTERLIEIMENMRTSKCRRMDG